MASITRTQHFQRDAVSLLAVQGRGTDRFVASGQPDTKRADFGAVFSGDLRVTRLASGNGYTFLLTDSKRGTDRKRVNFDGNALVRIGDRTMMVSEYYGLLVLIERVGL